MYLANRNDLFIGRRFTSMTGGNTSIAKSSIKKGFRYPVVEAKIGWLLPSGISMTHFIFLF